MSKIKSKIKERYIRACETVESENRASLRRFLDVVGYYSNFGFELAKILFKSGGNVVKYFIFPPKK